MPIFKAHRLLLEEWKRRQEPIPARWRLEFEGTWNPGRWVGEGPWRAYALETPERFEVTCNGEPLAFDPERYYLDPAFPLAPLPPLRQGLNVLEWRFLFTPDLELENSYLVGDFAVGWDGETRFWLEPERGTLHEGSWVHQGYPFYAGAIRYRTEVELPSWEGELWLHLEAVRNGVRVWWNGYEAGTRLWEPYRVEITPFARPGRNEVVLEVFNTLRNLFGPHHLRDEEQRTHFGPGDYVSEAQWVDSYRFVPCGLLGGVEVRRVKYG
jgi:hypothetical protein